MSDLEFLGASSASESYDPAAFERFKEQMKKNAAFMAAAQKSEQRQKEKEDRLAKILLKFIQSNQKSGILLLAARVLQENVPASFVLSMILLGNEEVQMELKRELEQEKLLLKAGEEDKPRKEPTEFSLLPAMSQQTLPLQLKAEIDAWGKGMMESASAVPFRILETAIDREGHVKRVIVDLAANVLSDFMIANQATALGHDTYYSFSEFLLRGIMEMLRKQIENQKELTQGTDSRP